MTTRMTARQKVEKPRDPQVKKSPKKFADIPKGALMAIPTAKIVEDAIYKIPEGKSWALTDLRNAISKKLMSEFTCPVTTGILTRIVVDAAVEDVEDGKPLSKVAPFWRLVIGDAPMFKKLSPETQKLILKMRKKEKLDQD